MRNLLMVIALLVVSRLSFAYDTKKECHDDCVRKFYEQKRAVGMEWIDVEADFAKMTPILNNYCACIDWCRTLPIPEDN